MTIRFVVPGEPKAKARPKFARAGKFVRTYTPQKSLNYEQKVGFYAAEQLLGHDTQMLEGPVALTVAFYFDRPKSRRRKSNHGQTTPRTVKPDVDNLVKAILDGLNHVAFKDDAQVWRMSVSKHETDDMPRTEVEIDYGEETA